MGGGEAHFIDLVNSLLARGHDVYVALRPDSPMARPLEVPSDRRFDLTLRNSLDIRSAIDLARLVRDLKIEVVHAHLGRDYPIAAIATNGPSKLICTRHVLFTLGKLQRITCKRISRFIAVSDPVAISLRSQRLVPADRITVVPNGVDIAKITTILKNTDVDAIRKKLNLERGRRLVVTVGELNPLKGHEDFVRAASIVARERPDVDFVIAGEDRSKSGENLKRLKAAIAREELENRVHLVGWVDNLPGLLAASDVFVSASHTESFGLAILEAMACGLPVVATRTGGAQELIRDLESGLTIKIRDFREMAKAIQSVLRDELLRITLGRNAAESARSEFSLESMVSRTEAVYRQALAPLAANFGDTGYGEAE
jgi:glycosyltransferase involved in cell wall biosynthesis